MDAFALPLVAFTVFMVGILVAMFWGVFDDPVPQRAAFIWAVTCPVAGLLCASGLAPLGLVSAAVSTLAPNGSRSSRPHEHEPLPSGL
jgi:hypothetical protein